MNKLVGLAVIVALIAQLGGCAKFQSRRRVDFTPFTEQTVAAVSGLDAHLTSERRVLTVEYLKEREDLYERFDPLAARLDELQRKIVDYSIVVGRLSRAGKTEEQQIHEVVAYLEGLRNSLVGTDPGTDRLTVGEADQILEAVRSKETIHEALLAAQPMINHVARVAARTVLGIRDILGELERSVNARIEEDFADLFAYDRTTTRQRVRLLSALEEIYRYREGDAEALARLLSSGLIPAAHLASLDLEHALRDVVLEEHLLSGLDRLGRAATVLQPELDRYRALHEEWDAMQTSFDGELRAIWSMMFMWTRAHERMALGVVDPAEWFDVDDTPQVLFSMARSAI